MNCSHIIDEMVWSYSRITTYETCPYRFFLTYILKLDKKRLFFSDYGSFIHSIIEKHLTGELKKSELDKYYLSEFQNNVVGRAPNLSIFKNYFQQGLLYMKNFTFPYSNVLEVEKEISFNIKGKPFVGFIDAVAKDTGIVVVDNKSRDLKQRSTRKKPTKSDEELDKYLRQLYFYCIGILNEYKELPEKLCFNCFRSGTVITEPFVQEKFEDAQNWALEMIDTIRNTTEWTPNVDYFVCNHLCDMCHHCEYNRLSERR